ncbi:MAG: hypothetical protein R3301_06280, partial [Saprospiraceae bacterium]|nr:hypothetical protein [Saprospiraceae bacterium]
SGRSGRAFWRGVLLTALIPLLAAVMLFFYFYHPVGLLVQGGEFQYGAGSLWDTWLEFARNSLYGRDYFGPGTFTVAAVVSGLICLLSIGYGLLRGARKIETKFAFFSALVAGGLILFFLLNYWIMGAQFPSGRKTIILYPAMALVVFAALRRAVHPRLFAGIGLGLSLLLLLHVVNVFSLRSFREWWYDASTKDMVYDLTEISETNGRPVTLATEWIFFPATQFYVDTQNLPVELIRTGKEVSPDAAATYYYVHPEHIQTLSPAYVVAAEYNGRVLMRQAEPD